jgi:integrase
MTTVWLKYMHGFVDRHGHARYYFRFRGVRWPMPAPGDPGFMAAYEGHLAYARELLASPKPKNVAFLRGTMGWAIEQFVASDDYLGRAANTKAGYRRVLDELRRRYGAAMLTTLKDRNVKQIRNDLRETFTASTADIGRGLLSTLWEFADERFPELGLGANPTHGISKVHRTHKAREPWPPDVIERFDAAASNSIRLALRLLLYTGQRRSDVVRMTWAAFDGKSIEVLQQKTGEPLTIPCHQALREALAAIPRRHEYILVHERGTGPYTGPGLASVFRAALRRLGVTGYSIHGLRKNAGVALAEAGCTTRQIMAILGHRTHGQAMHYTRRADQKREAEAAMKKWEQSGGNPRKRTGTKL